MARSLEDIERELVECERECEEHDRELVHHLDADGNPLPSIHDYNIKR